MAKMKVTQRETKQSFRVYDSIRIKKTITHRRSYSNETPLFPMKIPAKQKAIPPVQGVPGELLVFSCELRYLRAACEDAVSKRTGGNEPTMISLCLQCVQTG